VIRRRLGHTDPRLTRRYDNGGPMDGFSAYGLAALYVEIIVETLCG
jgi:hypothetical protein